MSIQFVEAKCPACGADIKVEGGRAFTFCTYCGSRMIINNDNEHIYRNIDEARLKEAETERMVMMRQLDMEEKSNISKKNLFILWVVATAVLFFLGIIGMVSGNEGMSICIMLGVCVGIWGGIGIFSNDKKKKKIRRYAGPNEVAISFSMEDYCEKNINSIVMLYRGAGFTNVTAIPLNDLTMFTQKKNGQVESVTINGNDMFEEGDIFPKNSNVLITYHSK